MWQWEERRDGSRAATSNHSKGDKMKTTPSLVLVNRAIYTHCGSTIYVNVSVVCLYYCPGRGKQGDVVYIQTTIISKREEGILSFQSGSIYYIAVLTVAVLKAVYS